MKKNFYRITTIITFTIISIIAASMTINYILKKEKLQLDKKYNNISFNMEDKINSLIQKKKNATLALSITLANNIEILNTLKKKNYRSNLGEVSQILRRETDFKNVWFQIINNEGISLYRSWSDKKNDELYKVREDLQQMLINPKIKSTISVGRYDISFKAMVPIFENSKFIGVIESITHFNSISRGLRISDNLEPIIVVEKKYTNQLRENAFSRIFLKDYYIANLSANKKILAYLENHDLEKLLEMNNYVLKDGYLIMNTKVKHLDKKLASFLAFKKLEDIDISDIQEYKKNGFLYLGLFILLLGLTLYVISYYLYSKGLANLYNELNENQKKLHDLNNSLQKTVDMEVEKNFEKNKILFQQSKMAAMGEMIGNIAHQWRQPLSLITTVASGIKLRKEMGALEDKEHFKSLDDIITSANYLSNTIDDFRYFFSPNKDKNRFSTDELFNKVYKLISTEFSNNEIEVITNIENIEVYSYENELLQVMINLLNNARDELIKIEDVNRRYIFIDINKKDFFLELKIKDSAGGISEEIIDRVFEPYFTTKHKSQGTGIGLYMSEEIIVKHMNGKIDISNEEYDYKGDLLKGAMFTINIPLN